MRITVDGSHNEDIARHFRDALRPYLACDRYAAVGGVQGFNRTRHRHRQEVQEEARQEAALLLPADRQQEDLRRARAAAHPDPVSDHHAVRASRSRVRLCVRALSAARVSSFLNH